MSGGDGNNLHPVREREWKPFFRTVTDGSDITKTPEDMFADPEIENNLKFVDDTIRDFYGWSKYEHKEDKQDD